MKPLLLLIMADYNALNARFGLSGANALRAATPAIAADPNNGVAAVAAAPAVTLRSLRARTEELDYAADINVAVGNIRNTYGPACNITVFNAAFYENPVFQTFVIYNCGVAPFSRAMETELVFKMAQLLSAARIHNSGARPMKETEFVASYQALALGELLGPFIPAEKRVPQANARERIIRAVRSLIEDAEMISGRIPEFADWYDDALGIPAPAEGDGAQNGQYLIEGMTIQTAMVILEAMASVLATHKNWQDRLGCISMMLVATAKKGTMTQELAQKVENACKDELKGARIVINPATCAAFYGRYCTGINETNAAQYFRYLHQLIPERIVSLRNVIVRAAGSGLTTYMTILRAMNEYQDFSWAVLRAVVPNDFGNLEAAIQAVGGNAFFGYAANAGAAAASKFRSLAYASFQLCIIIGGDTKLRDYMGKPTVVPHKSVIDTLIASYRQAQEAAVENMEVDQNMVAATAAIVESARQAHVAMNPANPMAVPDNN